MEIEKLIFEIACIPIHRTNYKAQRRLINSMPNVPLKGKMRFNRQNSFTFSNIQQFGLNLRHNRLMIHNGTEHKQSTVE